MKNISEAVICGAGIAGISAAYHLAVVHGLRSITLVDPNPPLSVTSDKSTECYRNWWPGPGNAMVDFMNRSIDWMERLAAESRNAFQLSRRGYLYLTADPAKIPDMQAAAAEISALGAGPLRVHTGVPQDPDYQPAHPEGFDDEPSGADLILSPDLLRQQFPYLSESTVAALHVRRAGWFSAQQLGAYLLEKARECGVQLLHAHVAGIDAHSGRVQAVRLEGGGRIETGCFIAAPGPMLKQVGRMLDIDLPVYTELHLKASFKDTLGAVPRHAPLLIWTDAQRLPWSDEERELLAEDPETRWLLDPFPPGVHTRPEGGGDSNIALMLWEYSTHEMEPVWPIPLDPDYPELALRGLSTMLPALRAYFSRMSRPWLDGGYYTRTRENRPLIGRLPVEGAFVVGALSGYGLMAACAAGELVALHATGGALPAYAPAFALERYQDHAYRALFDAQSDSGQL